MKIEIEIDEETAACLWADRTWEGRSKLTMAAIVKDVVEESATKYRQAFPAAVKRVTQDFRAKVIDPDGAEEDAKGL